MDVFIYATPGFGHPKDQIEDALDDMLGALGEVTGGGSGESGVNIDIEIYDDQITSDEVLTKIRALLQSFDVPQNIRIVIDRQSYSVYN